MTFLSVPEEYSSSSELSVSLFWPLLFFAPRSKTLVNLRTAEFEYLVLFPKIPVLSEIPQMDILVGS